MYEFNSVVLMIFTVAWNLGVGILVMWNMCDMINIRIYVNPSAHTSPLSHFRILAQIITFTKSVVEAVSFFSEVI